MVDDGTLDLFHASNAQLIRSLSGGGGVVLGPTTLCSRRRSDRSGSIYNVYAPGDAPKLRLSGPYHVAKWLWRRHHRRRRGDVLRGQLLFWRHRHRRLWRPDPDRNPGEQRLANAGYFQNDGVVRMMTVSTGAVANGAFAGGLDVASGLISPGDPGQTGGGHMTIGTGLSLGADATYLVRAAGAAVSRIDVNGAATIGGSTLDTMFAAVPLGAVLGQRNTVLTASNGVVGQFGAFNFNLGYAASRFPLPRRQSRLCAGRRFLRYRA